MQNRSFVSVCLLLATLLNFHFSTTFLSADPFADHSTLSSGLKFYYPMNEASGTMEDATGNFADITGGGGTVGDSGPSGGPLDGSYVYKWVDETDFSYSVGSSVGHPTLDIDPDLSSDSASFSLMVWVYCDGDLDPDGVTDNTEYSSDNDWAFAILGWGSPNHNSARLGFAVKGDDDYGVAYRDNGSLVEVADADELQSVNPLQWNLFGLTYDESSNTLKWWLNGAVIGSVNPTSIDHDLDSSGRFQLARYINYSWTFNGYLNGFAMWDRALTTTEFSDLWNSGDGLVYDDVASSDTTPPSVPGSLSTSSVAQTSLTLSWSASTDSESGVANYKVYVDEVLDQTVSTTSANITGLFPNTEYDLTVSAVDVADNESSQSSVLQETTSADSTAPSVPAGLTLGAKTDTSVSFTWTASTDDYSGVPNYHVYVDDTYNQTVSSASATVTSLTETTEYEFKVSALDGSANESAKSSALTVTTEEAASGPFAGHSTLSSGLKFYYPMNEASGTMEDATGNFADMTGGGGAVGDSGPSGGPLDGSYVYKWVDETDFSYSVGSSVGHPTLDIDPDLSSDSASFSLMVWVYCDGDLDPDGVTDNTEYSSDNDWAFAILGWGSPDHNSARLGFAVKGDDDYGVAYRDNGSLVEVADADELQSVNPLQWNLFGLTYDESSNTLKWWLNGAVIGSVNPTSIDHDLDSSGRFQLARYINYSWTFNGYLNGFAMWDRALTTTEFSDLWNSGDGLVYDDMGSSDTTPPSTPSNLSWTDFTDATVTFSWDASTDNGPGPITYAVFPDDSDTQISNLTITGTEAVVDSLSAGTEYSYRVKAFDAASNASSYSSTLEVLTNTPPEFDDTNFDLARNTEVEESYSMDLDNEFIDADSDTLTFTVQGLSGNVIGWLTWDGGAHTLSGTPSYSELGLLEVTVTVDDDFTLSPPEYEYEITVTSPISPTADEDHDGMYDLWELIHGLDPNDPSDALTDDDEDLLTNLQEFVLDSDPNSAASNDLDSIPDDWETFYGLDTSSSVDNSGDDEEPDGLTNASEYSLGTDPTKRDHPDVQLTLF